MKKLAVLFVSIAAAFGASAQTGRMAAGIDLGVAPCVESGVKISNFGLGAKFQYGITDPIRVEADVEYWLKDKGTSIFDITLNAHYLFRVTDKLSVYPLVGIGYAHFSGGGDVDYDDDYDYDDFDFGFSRASDDFDYDLDVEEGSSSNSRFIFNIGAGAEYALTGNISAFVEAKYQYMKDFSRIPIQLGVTYKF